MPPDEPHVAEIPVAEPPVVEYDRRLDERRQAAMAEMRRWTIVFLSLHMPFMFLVGIGESHFGIVALSLAAVFWLASAVMSPLTAIPTVRDWPALSRLERFTGFTPAGIILTEGAILGVLLTARALRL